MNPTQFIRNINSTLPAIPVLAQEIEDWGQQMQVNAKHIFQINLILEELITNIIYYGYQQENDKKIEIRLVLQQSDHCQLMMTIIDEAPAFNPLGYQKVDSPDNSIDKMPVGGLGIYLVRLLSHHIDYSYTGKGNQLVLYKTLDCAC